MPIREVVPARELVDRVGDDLEERRVRERRRGVHAEPDPLDGARDRLIAPGHVIQVHLVVAGVVRCVDPVEEPRRAAEDGNDLGAGRRSVRAHGPSVAEPRLFVNFSASEALGAGRLRGAPARRRRPRARPTRPKEKGRNHGRQTSFTNRFASSLAPLVSEKCGRSCPPETLPLMRTFSALDLVQLPVLDVASAQVLGAQLILAKAEVQKEEPLPAPVADAFDDLSGSLVALRQTAAKRLAPRPTRCAPSWRINPSTPRGAVFTTGSPGGRRS